MGKREQCWTSVCHLITESWYFMTIWHVQHLHKCANYNWCQCIEHIYKFLPYYQPVARVDQLILTAILTILYEISYAVRMCELYIVEPMASSPATGHTSSQRHNIGERRSCLTRAAGNIVCYHLLLMEMSSIHVGVESFFTDSNIFLKWMVLRDYLYILTKNYRCNCITIEY